MSWAMGKLIAILLSTAALTGLTACNVMISSEGKIDAASVGAHKITFQTLQNKYRPRSSFNMIEHVIDLEPEVVKQCAVGELDLLNAATECGGQDKLIVTVKDNEQEKIVKTVNPGTGQSGLDAFEIDVQSVRTHGENLDLFVCIDGNGNGQCADEAIKDLNAASVNVVAQGNRGACGTLNDGVLLYHHYEQMAQNSGTTYVVALQYDSISEEAQLSLQNLETVPKQSTATEKPKFPIRLAKSDPSACPPAVRTDGCFAKGTEIQLPGGKTAKVEDLKGNDVIQLADGRSALINKIVSGPETEHVLTFETEDGQKITVTAKHPMMTGRGLVMAREVKAGDQLKTAKRGYIGLSAIRRHEYKEKVYNFALKGGKHEADHLVVANGFVSGELYLQNALVQKDHPEKLASK